MQIGSGITIGSNIIIGDLPTQPFLPPYLYVFNTFTFQTGNIVGPTGPTAVQLFANSYSNVGNTWLQNTSYYNTSGNGYQYWTVPLTGNYQITAAGARSGYSQFTGNTAWAANSAGLGATIRATVPLTQGQVITIAVGQPSANAPSNASFSVAGGGGGTFVVFTNNNAPIVVAGGGGGAGNWASNTSYTNYRGGNAVTTNWGGNSWAGAAGGFNGQGGNAHVNIVGVTSLNGYDGGGGGGFYSNGVVGSGSNVRTNFSGTASGAYGGGGQSFFANLLGGVVTSSYSTYNSPGGWGGGGGPGALGAGGGGGYSGGSGSFGPSSTTVDNGGGGGSYIIAGATSVATTDGNYNGSNSFSGASITNLNSYNTGPGYVTITKVA
jgi:hypothetical protein